ncbi:MAG: hypothetical protein ACI4P5_10285 [Candidatus Fimadaptatus sp.]
MCYAMRKPWRRGWMGGAGMTKRPARCAPDACGRRAQGGPPD